MPSNFFVACALFFVTVAASPAQADGLTYSQIHCGDHWFNFNISLDPDTHEASVRFYGDSSPDTAARPASYLFESDHSVRVNFQDEEGGYIEIDGSDFAHDIYWGTGRLSAHGRGAPDTFGLCDVE